MLATTVGGESVPLLQRLGRVSAEAEPRLASSSTLGNHHVGPLNEPENITGTK